MRTHFISRLALLLGAGFLVVASQVFSEDTLQWLFVAGGVAMILTAAADAAAPGLGQRRIDVAIIVVGAWSVVQALVFTGSNATWVSFGTAVALAALAVIGLITHELGVERVVHELHVTTEHRQTPTGAF